MRVKSLKFFRTASKLVLLITGLFLLGYVGYTSYLSIRFRPYKVRVSNVTDSAFTVSWITDAPMTGVVYYGDKDNFLPGPLSWLGKSKAEDDRDVSNAQTDCVSNFNKEVAKSRDENFVVDASGFNCNDVEVEHRGRYYTHHVTVGNLDSDKEYYFRVGNGFISFKEGKTEGVGYMEREMPAVSEFKQKTLPILEEVTSPQPAYGTSYNVFYSSDGQVGAKKNFDSIIFLKTFKEGDEYPLMSAVTNNDGGWSIDLSNVRGVDGSPLELANTYLEFIPQVDNAKPGSSGTTKYENLVFPLDLMGNSLEDSGDVEEIKNSRLLQELVSKSYAATCLCKMGSTCKNMNEFVCEDNGGSCVSSCSTPTPPKVTCWTSTCPAKSTNELTSCGGNYPSKTPPNCSVSVKKICYSCKSDGSIGEREVDQNAKCLDTEEESKDKLNCSTPTVDCYCTSNDCKTVLKKEGSICKMSDGCYITKAVCDKKLLNKDDQKKSCCKVSSSSSSGVSCTCQLKESCSQGEIEGEKSKCEACFKVVKGECKDGCQEYKVINSCLGGGGGGGSTHMLTQNFSPFERFFVKESYAKLMIPDSGTTNRVCPVGQETCEDEGGSNEGDVCWYTLTYAYLPEKDWNGVYRFTLSGTSGLGGAYPNCDGSFDYIDGVSCIVPKGEGEECAPVIKKTVEFNEDNKYCYQPGYRSDGSKYCSPFLTTAEDCGGYYDDWDSCFAAGYELCDITSSTDPNFRPYTPCACPSGTALAGKVIGLDGKAENCGTFDYEVDACYVYSGGECQLYKENISYSECLKNYGYLTETECIDKSGKYCWERSGTSGAGECVLSNVDRSIDKDCKSRLSLYKSLYECDDRLTCYEPVLKDSKCNAVNCSSNNSNHAIFSNADDCTDYIKKQLEGNTIEAGERCTASMPCYCSASGTYVGNNECCGNTRYDFSYTSHVEPTLVMSECTAEGLGGQFCNMEECLLRRDTVIFVNIAQIEKEQGFSYRTSYDPATQQVCVQAAGEQCALKDLYIAYIQRLSPCDRSKCGVVLPTPPGPSGLVSRAYAQDEGDGQWEDNVVFYSPDDGVYEVTSSEGVSKTVLGGQATVFYHDRNGIEGFQPAKDPQNPREDEDIIISGTSLSVSKVADLKKITLKKGINLISFNLLPSLGTGDEKLTFRDFLHIANKEGDNVSRISAFRAGKWDGGAQYDFTTKEVKGQVEEALSMGIGYVVIAEKDVDILVPGYSITSPVPISFSSGWNLVGVHGHSKSYTAKTFIESINSTSGLQADNVTWWPTSRGMYQGFQLSDGQEYGQDFPISKELGYFVRVNDINPDCRSIWWNPGEEDNGKCSN